MKSNGGSSRPRYYLAGAIRGDTSFLEYQHPIREVVGRYGEIYTERSESYIPLDKYTGSHGAVKEQEIYDRDMKWLQQSDAVIAEVSGASTGTGREIGKAIDILKIPTFCLYRKSSRPSLIVKRERSEYAIVQEYEEQKDLKAYLTSFMEVVSETDDINEIRRVYFAASRQVAQLDFQTDKISEYVKSLLRAIHKIRPIDFKDSKDFAVFMFRSIVLQSRWERLGSQRIGSTFISGDKPRIIGELVQFDIRNLSDVTLKDHLSQANDDGAHRNSPEDRHSTIHLTHIYRQLRRNRVKYSRWALTKNLRAYRRLGLVLSNGEIKHGASKFRDQIYLVESLRGRKLVSSSSRRSVMNPKIRPTKHVHDLFRFIRKYGARPLIDSLMEFQKKNWWSIISDLQKGWQLDIDQIKLDDVLHYDWAPKLVEDLQKKCKEIWEHEYSSFNGTRSSDTSIRSNANQATSVPDGIDPISQHS